MATAQAKIQASVNGLLPSGFTTEGKVVFDLARLETFAPAGGPRAIEIGDARALQQGSASEAAFFDRHGFVLLPHRTAVEDWELPPGTPPAESHVARTYFPEVEALIRERLLPGRSIMVIQPGPPVRRGRDTNNGYAEGVHQDFGLTPDDFQEGLGAFSTPEYARLWRDRFDLETVEGFMIIDLWRPTNMQGPLKHMPLALCDPGTVRLEDVIPTAMLGVTPTGRPSNQLSLRHQPDQAWWFYPDMRGDEVLAFKLFEFFKPGPPSAMRTCFHTAFHHPDTPADAELRQSCEHRVSVVFLRDGHGPRS